jgi:hypothetical protein
VLVNQTLQDRGRALAVSGLVFGIVAGAFQTLGFVRWAVLTPYLARAATDPSLVDVTREAIALVEGSFNRYAGMAVGEHAATMALSLWTLCLALAMRRDPAFDPRLGAVGLGLTPLAVLPALEPLGVLPRSLTPAVDVAFPAWVVWLVVTAAALWRVDAATGVGPRLTWRTAAWAVPLFFLLAAPMLLARAG